MAEGVALQQQQQQQQQHGCKRHLAVARTVSRHIYPLRSTAIFLGWAMVLLLLLQLLQLLQVELG
jgi:hypothetical protein